MASRRHFGSVRKRASGRWQASYWHRGEHYHAATTFATKRDAQAWLSETETHIRAGRWVDPRAGSTSLADYATKWLADRSDLRATTRAKYAALLARHILPTLGRMPISAVTPTKVRTWYHTLARQYQTTADDAYRLLRAIFNTAIADGHLGRSPCTVKGAGQIRSPERPTASVVEVAAAVLAVPDRYRLALLLAPWCQLRRGEVLALQRRHLDRVHYTVRIEQAWVVPYGGQPMVGPPKTESGVRVLAIPPNIWPAVEDHLEQFVGSEPQAWLFATSTGTAVSPRNFNRVWDRARRAAGRPDLHLHDLRHSGLTWSAASGASVFELMRRGGHKDPRAAMKYQHATEDRDRAIAEALGRLAATPSEAPTAAVADTTSRPSRPNRARPSSRREQAPSAKGA
jgi:integrase